MSSMPRAAVKRQTVALIPALLNVFIMGCSIGWIGNTIYFFLAGEEVTASPNEITIIASCTELGRLMFAIPSGLLTDKYGRRKIIICAALAHFFSWFLLSFHISIILIYLSRFASGMATAMVDVTSLNCIGEIASPEIRGKFVSLYTLFVLSGTLMPSIIAVIYPSYYGLSYGIAFLSFMCLIPTLWTMETPNYLISVSEYEKAKRNLKRIRLGYHEEDVSHEFLKLKKYIDDEKTRKRQLSWLMFFKSKSISKPLGIFILLNFVAASTGYVVLTAYITVINPKNDYIPNQYYPLIMRIILIIPFIGTTFYIDKFSRKSIFMTGALLCGMTCAFCAFVDYWYLRSNEDLYKWLFTFGNLAICLINGGSLIPMTSALKAELLPQSVKGIGGSLGVMAQASSAMILYRLYNFITNNFSLYYLYVIFFCNSMLLCLLVFFLLPEGRGKPLADIQKKFNNKSSSVNDISENRNNLL